MFTPSVTLSPLTLRNVYGLYLLVRLRAEEALSGVAAAAQGMQDRLWAAMEAGAEATAEREVAYHRRRHARKAFRVERRALALTVLGKCENNHGARAYRRLFPKGYAVMRAKTVRQLVEIGQALMAGLESETDPDIRAHIPRMAAALAGLESALADYESRCATAARCAADLGEAKATWLDQYAWMYHRLFEIFPRDRALIETYFRPRRHSPTEDVGQGEEPEEPGEPEEPEPEGTEAMTGAGEQNVGGTDSVLDDVPFAIGDNGSTHAMDDGDDGEYDDDDEEDDEDDEDDEIDKDFLLDDELKDILEEEESEPDHSKSAGTQPS